MIRVGATINDSIVDLCINNPTALHPLRQKMFPLRAVLSASDLWSLAAAEAS